MKKTLIFSVLAIAVFGLFFMGVKDRTRPNNSAVVFGNDKDQSFAQFGGATGDTIVVSDTLQYPIIVNHSKVIKPFIQLDWTKIGSGTATVAVTFWQSNDGTNYNQIVKGKNQAAYAKTLTITATGSNFISFATDTAILEGKYLKIRYITSSTASVKGKLAHKIKFNL
jgi:hypothetical protein